VRSCRGAGKSRLLVIDEAGPGARLIWKWIKGESTSQADFSDPTAGAQYDLCLFAGTAAAHELNVGPDAQKWSAIGSRGFLYRDRAGAQDGVRKLLLRGSDSDHTRIELNGNSASVVHPPLGLPITVQLTNSDTDVCWSASFDAAEPNRVGKLKATTTAP
jgi:hypothetical protein